MGDTMHSADIPEPPSPATQPDRSAKTFDNLIRTEAALIESNAFKHVNHVAYINLHDGDWWDDLGERAVSLRYYTLYGLIHESDEFVSEWGVKPNLIYSMNEDGSIDAVFH